MKWSPLPPGGQSLQHYCSTRFLQAQHRPCLRLLVSGLYSDMPTFTTALVSRQAFRVGSIISAQKRVSDYLRYPPCCCCLFLVIVFCWCFLLLFCLFLFCCSFCFYYCWLWGFDLEGNTNFSALLSGPEGCNSSLLTNCGIVTTSSSNLTDTARRNYCLALSG